MGGFILRWFLLCFKIYVFFCIEGTDLIEKKFGDMRTNLSEKRVKEIIETAFKGKDNFVCIAEEEIMLQIKLVEREVII